LTKRQSELAAHLSRSIGHDNSQRILNTRRSPASDKGSPAGFDMLEEGHTYQGRTQRSVGELSLKTLIDWE
jgi:hypothetical protein